MWTRCVLATEDETCTEVSKPLKHVEGMCLSAMCRPRLSHVYVEMCTVSSNVKITPYVSG